MRQSFLLNRLLLIQISLFAAVCQCGAFAQTRRATSADAPSQTQTALAAESERDRIGLLLAYAMVVNSWQDQDLSDSREQRGHNIGAVLVSEENEILAVKQNAAYVTGDRSQHAEVRTMQSYLSLSEAQYLDDCTVYTTLEPCPMCAGMMLMLKVRRAVWGQKDPEYGNALDNLSSYPRKTASVTLGDPISAKLEAEFRELLVHSPKSSITDFLYTDSARSIMEEAKQSLLDMEVVYAVNNSFLETARSRIR